MVVGVSVDVLHALVTCSVLGIPVGSSVVCSMCLCEVWVYVPVGVTLGGCTHLACYLLGTTLFSFISTERQRQQNVTVVARRRLRVVRQQHAQAVHL